MPEEQDALTITLNQSHTSRPRTGCVNQSHPNKSHLLSANQIVSKQAFSQNQEWLGGQELAKARRALPKDLKSQSSLNTTQPIHLRSANSRILEEDNLEQASSQNCLRSLETPQRLEGVRNLDDLS